LYDGNNCHILTGEEMQKEQLLRSYLVPGEKPYVMLKSAKEEFIFTERAFISVMGNSTVGTKKDILRYDYYRYTVGSVTLNTPGNSVASKPD
jgi:hypothetical protein